MKKEKDIHVENVKTAKENLSELGELGVKKKRILTQCRKGARAIRN